jgi:hypothetical protein
MNNEVLNELLKRIKKWSDGGYRQHHIMRDGMLLVLVDVECMVRKSAERMQSLSRKYYNVSVYILWDMNEYVRHRWADSVEKDKELNGRWTTTLKNDISLH